MDRRKAYSTTLARLWVADIATEFHHHSASLISSTPTVPFGFEVDLAGEAPAAPAESFVFLAAVFRTGLSASGSRRFAGLAGKRV